MAKTVFVDGNKALGVRGTVVTAAVMNGLQNHTHDGVDEDGHAPLIDVVPTGAMLPYGGAAAPSGWLLCDGASYLRADHAALFAIIGTAYGAADGTHFNVPDMRGRSPVGAGIGAGGGATGTGLPAGGSALTSRARGAWYGEESHVSTINETPSHNHGGATGGQSANHSHTANDLAHALGGNVVPGEMGGYYAAGNTGGASNDHTHAIASQGGGLAHNNVQPSMTVNFIIKA